MNVDRGRSLALAKQLRAKLCDCYRNAFRGMREYPTGRYVVGWAFIGEYAEAHAWIETDDGAIIDPTDATTRTRKADRERFATVFGRLPAPHDVAIFSITRYEPVKRFTIQEISQAAASRDTWFAATALSTSSPAAGD